MSKIDEAEALRLYSEGLPIAEVARRSKVSRQYLHFRLSAHPDYEEARTKSRQNRHKFLAERRRQKTENLIPEVRQMLEEGRKVREIRALSHAHNRAVSLLDELEPDLVQRGRDVAGAKPHDAEKILRQLRNLSIGFYMTEEEYDAQRPSHYVSSQTIHAKFGSWRRACRMAGLRNVPDRLDRGFQRRKDAYTMDEVVDALKQCHQETGKVPTSYVYRKWSTGREGVPSTRPVIKCFGGSWPSPTAWMDPEVDSE